MKSLVLAFALSIAILPTTALADVPGLMNYQGTLTDDVGIALDTTVAMTFSIYNDSTGGMQVWTETQTGVEVVNGVFNVLLGSVNTISDTVFKVPSRWLGVQVEGDPEIQPRQRIAGVGYSFRAAEADTAEYARSGGGTDGWIDDGTVVRLESDTDSVGIGTSTPAAKLDVQGTLSVGQDSSGYDVNFYGGGGLYSGARFFWDEDKMALRAGRDSDGTNWAPDSVGEYSLATGYDTKASGYSSTAMGNGTIASGDYSTALGDGSTASGWHSTAMGGMATASGDLSIAMGRLAFASGYASTAIGRYVSAETYDAIVIGRGMAPPIQLVNNIENSLMVGFGDTTATLFVGGPDDRVGIGTSTPAYKLDVNGTTRMTGFSMPTGASAGYVLTSDSSGMGTWQTAGGGIGGSGTANYISKFTGATTIGNSAIYESGADVGIGTTSPAARLHVVTDTTTGIVIEGGAQGLNPNVRLIEDGGQHARIMLREADGNALQFWAGANEAMTIQQDGDVGIGTRTPGYKLQVGESGDGTEARANAWNLLSSRDYKKDISPFETVDYQQMLEKLRNTQVVRYRFVRDENGTEHIGVIAEDAPGEILSPDGKGISLGDYSAFLLAAIKAQQEQIGVLEKEITELRSELQRQR